MPETIHCRKCGQSMRVKNFPDQMAKIRHHYKVKHPRVFKASIKKGVAKRKSRR